MSRGDIEERYLLRLGAGERDLRTSSSHDFTKTGRVAYSLSERSKLLEQVQLLSESLGVSSKAERGKNGESAYTCETADYFNLDHVLVSLCKGIYDLFLAVLYYFVLTGF